MASLNDLRMGLRQIQEDFETESRAAFLNANSRMAELVASFIGDGVTLVDNEPAVSYDDRPARKY